MQVARFRTQWLILPALLSGCVSPLELTAFDGQLPVMRPEVFFAGSTTSYGVIATSKGKPSRILRVSGSGRTLPDGSFQLDQTVTYDDGKSGQRTWIMKSADSMRYTATLTDAAGPVRAEVHGNLFHLRYLLKRPAVYMEQWLYLQPDNRTVLNEGRISMAGMTIARLSERITRSNQAETTNN
jgi:hypothetical protein